MIYNLFYFSSVFLNIATYRDVRVRQALYYVLLAAMFVFSSLRWRVGCDWAAYLHHSTIYGPEPYSVALQKSEALYWLLVSLLHQLNLEYPFINILAGLVFFGGLHSLAKRQPDRLLFLTLLFPILVTGIAMSATRQAFAVGIICYAFNAISDNKKIKYIILVIIASQFHSSAIIFISFAPIISNNLNYKNILFFGIISIPALIYIYNLDSIRIYSDLYVGTVHDAGGGPFRATLNLISGLIFYLLLKDKWKIFSPNDYNLVYIMAPGLILIFFVVFYSSVIGDRFGYYLNPIQAIILSRAYLFYKTARIHTMFVLPMLMFGAALIVWSQFSWIFQACYSQYQFWW